MYVKGRTNWLINSFRDYQCGCGETEMCTLVWHPHHRKIRNLVYRNGAKSTQRQEAIKLMELSTPVCRNCAAKYEYGLEPFLF